ncbi:AAA family ATPase [Candidatus Falkowbacteria bacterium]|nr:AAA family ATPase [Candidatus Falkowbacteria bacterium]
MYLSKLELTGFKSFARKTTLTFPKLEVGQTNITAVVGPNGSGKANIADAIRWVTGEQSLKNLRGKKSEDIIFSGTNKSARLGYAEVSLYLDNSDKKAPIDYTELIITRKLYRSGESEYQINGSKSRLADILLLMAQLSFGQKSYSIIGQGMADAILAATATERKDFLNEAAGIKQYQIKRDTAINKLELTKNNLGGAETLTSEIEPRLRSLTRQVKKLERRSEIEKKLKHFQIKFYSHRWFLNLTSWETLRSKLKNISNERQEVEKKFNSLTNQLSDLAIEDKEDGSFEKLQSQYNRIQEVKNNLLHQKTVLSAKLEVLSMETPERTKHSQVCSLSIAETEDILKVLIETKSLQEKLINETKTGNLESVKLIAAKIINQINSTIMSIRRENETAEDTKEKGNEKISELKKQITSINIDINAEETELKKIQEKISSLERKRREERSELFELQKQIQTKQNELNKFSANENNIKIELARIETHKEDLETEIKQKLGSLDKLTKGTTDESPSETHSKIQKYKHQLELIGGIDPEITKEYQETKNRFEHLDHQITDLKKATESLEKLIKELDGIIKNRFNSSFEKINAQFQKFFKTLFDGGSAKLIYTKEIITKTEVPEDSPEQSNPEKTESPSPVSCPPSSEIKEGVEIEATPPGKRLKSINMLSGGERALTSIALICAIIANNPSPFVVLDEVDAALDEANSVRFAAILEDLSHKTQFVVITHNRATMEKGKILYGVTMGENGISKLLSIKMEEIK